MKVYEIKRVDGRPCWDTIDALPIDVPYLNTPGDIVARAQIAYDSTALYLHLWAKEPDVRCVETGLLGSPCEDSCLEFFFCPVENDNRYLNIEFNANGCLYLGIADSIQNLVRLLVPDVEALMLPDIRKRDDGWEIFYQVPYSLIQRFFPDFTVYESKSMRANCYK